MDWLLLIEKAFWGGWAAVGFAVLFNVPARALISVYLLGLLGVFTKFLLLGMGLNVVLPSFIGASLVGILSIRAAHAKHAPPLIFAIPAVIPLVPGIFAYKTMLGIIALTGNVTENFNQTLAETVNNGAKASFIIMSLAVGVGVPNLITRKNSAKEMVIHPPKMVFKLKRRKAKRKNRREARVRLRRIRRQ